jgi:hypothetical protein
MKKVEVKERVPSGEPTHLTLAPRFYEALRKARELGPEDLERARDTLPDAPVRRLDERPPYFVPPRHLEASAKLGNYGRMPDVQDEALKLLGSFARFVQKEAPEAAEQLGPLAVEWARAKGISQDRLLEAILQADEWG